MPLASALKDHPAADGDSAPHPRLPRPGYGAQDLAGVLQFRNQIPIFPETATGYLIRGERE